MIELSTEIREALRVSSGGPIRMQDPTTHQEYVLLTASEFETLYEASSQSEFSAAEQGYLLTEAGRRAGWDDPEMDVYNDLIPKGEA